jgi:hypothetical protein
MKKVLLLSLVALFSATEANGQGTRILVQPTCREHPIVLDQAVPGSTDSLVLHTLRFYLGHITLWRNGATVWRDDTYHLVDLENDPTRSLTLVTPPDLDFDQLSFSLGVDSLTQSAGVLGGDLDPSKGMFWSWQSGYINAKIEGFSRKSPARRGTFEWHLGGFRAPFSANQTVLLAAKPQPNLSLIMDITTLMERCNWSTQHHIMSPGPEAAALSAALAQAFRLYAP